MSAAASRNPAIADVAHLECVGLLAKPVFSRSNIQRWDVVTAFNAEIACQFANFALDLIQLDFKPASVDFNNNRLLRPIIISFLGGIGYGDVISTAQSAFKRQYAAVTSALVVEATVEHAKLISPFQISFDNRKILVASI
ncbi:hypothetical protein EGR_04910 [Echinococcus granulosus]|uniref:Uncharacterized protein n=1 Tax=Echinococcus granulosus TaxID=6210 RepID=W6UFJ4_ECHGR|nr:hypothetical protein EGR_04910 [Echinococcus granulosus]EUB60200.1 hypothetical protein EGR_04910 [Echinococcus granulosus]